ncbi:hypothetical protein ACH42_02450 [Endozoicomonas sp. (ex Bugula neritina AB1)]|nr:hypothetical protein ACH42_02450 [Endozoicomonas sp. (ex Bugula neritina AB1)]
MSRHSLDAYDIRILKALQLCDSNPLHELADQIKLSVSQCSRRISRLKEQGYIKQQVTLLDPASIGLDVEAFISVSLSHHTPEQAAHFQDRVKDMLPVMECYAVTGSDADYLLRIVATNQKSLSQFLMNELMSIPGVCNIKTSLMLNAIKSTTALPLDL